MKVSWCIGKLDSHPPINSLPFHEWILPGGIRWALFFRLNQGYLIRFPDFADFYVTRDGTEVICWPESSIPDTTINHLYYNQVLPLALSVQGELILHASAVEIRSEAIAFLGKSGMGKSTLAASFAQAGNRFLTDDALAISQAAGRFEAHPGRPSVRLWEDSRSAVIEHTPQTGPAVHYTSKAQLLADEALAFCVEARVLKKIFVLGNNVKADVEIVRLGAHDAMLELIQHSFLLDIDGPSMLSHHFEFVSQLVAKTAFYRLDYARRYESLPEVRNAIIHHMK